MGYDRSLLPLRGQDILGAPQEKMMDCFEIFAALLTV
jgi:hypothetical protein